MATVTNWPLHVHYGIALWAYIYIYLSQTHSPIALHCMHYSITLWAYLSEPLAAADQGFGKGGFQYALDWSHKTCERARARGGARGDRSPQENFLISDLLRSLLVPFWGETGRVGRPTANLVIVFEAKLSVVLKVCYQNMTKSMYTI